MLGQYLPQFSVIKSVNHSFLFSILTLAQVWQLITFAGLDMSSHTHVYVVYCIYLNYLLHSFYFIFPIGLM